MLMPYCSVAVVVCGSPATYAHGIAKTWGAVTYKAKSLAECDDGYFLEGPDWRYCQADGSWSDTEIVSQCKPRDCGLPQQQKNAFAKPWHCPDGSAYPAQCSSECVSGYELVMPTSPESLAYIDNSTMHLKCRADGKWAGFVPECKIKRCGLANSVVMGIDNCPNGDAVGSECTFTCEPGYHLTGKG